MYQIESDTSQDFEYQSPWTASFRSCTCKCGYMGILNQTFCHKAPCNKYSIEHLNTASLLYVTLHKGLIQLYEL